ncbi:MAG: hypothetical protein WBP64_09555 [Nitrososphaeraceae archaeon]
MLSALIRTLPLTQQQHPHNIKELINKIRIPLDIFSPHILEVNEGTTGSILNMFNFTNGHFTDKLFLDPSNGTKLNLH